MGAGAQQCTESMKVAVALSDGSLGTYEAPIVPNSPIPGLLGLLSLTEKRSLIDTYSKKIYFVGPGGYKIQLSPGSRALDLENSPSGHLLLPVTEFESVRSSRSDTNMAFVSRDC